MKEYPLWGTISPRVKEYPLWGTISPRVKEYPLWGTISPRVKEYPYYSGSIEELEQWWKLNPNSILTIG